MKTLIRKLREKSESYGGFVDQENGVVANPQIRILASDNPPHTFHRKSIRLHLLFICDLPLSLSLSFLLALLRLRGGRFRNFTPVLLCASPGLGPRRRNRLDVGFSRISVAGDLVYVGGFLGAARLLFLRGFCLGRGRLLCLMGFLRQRGFGARLLYFFGFLWRYVFFGGRHCWGSFLCCELQM